MIQVEIWSDLACPFCYIGKRHFEAALARFPHRDQVKVAWRSFELDSGASSDPGRDLYDVLAAKYGRDRDWAKEMTGNVTRSAAAVGLSFDMDRVVPSSTFDAHRLIHLAASRGIQDQAEERLFSAYFCEGRQLSDPATLKALGQEIGLDPEEVGQLLEGTTYQKEVLQEEDEAEALGIRSVPFFVLNRKFAVSGAQPVEVFVDALHSAWTTP